MTPASPLRHFLLLNLLFLIFGGTGCVPPTLSSGVAPTSTFVTATIPAPTTESVPSIPATSTVNLLSTSTFTPTPTLPSLSTLEGCAIGSTRVRSGPGIDYALASGLGEKECVQILGRNQEANWVYITGTGKNGWVFAPLLNISGEIAQLHIFLPDENPLTLFQTVQFQERATPLPDRTLLPTRTPTPTQAPPF